MLINNHYHPALAGPIKAGSIGRAIRGWTATILAELKDEEIGPGQFGRVAMRLSDSPLSWFAGYDGDPAMTVGRITKNGLWYVTGNTGRMDEDGFFYFSGREDDVIIMAGYRIRPFEAESVIARHPAVAECAVLAVPDEVRGDVIEAYVVLREGEGASPALERSIQQFVKREYAGHAYPGQVHFTGALPKTPSGKIQRFLLQEWRINELAVPTGSRAT